MKTSTAIVVCPDCGDAREITTRQRRRLESGGRSFLCAICRTINQPAIVRESDKKWWLDRYSMEWIVETAGGIWGDDE